MERIAQKVPLLPTPLLETQDTGKVSIVTFICSLSSGLHISSVRISYVTARIKLSGFPVVVFVLFSPKRARWPIFLLNNFAVKIVPLNCDLETFRVSAI